MSIQICPSFEDLTKPKTILNHVQELKKKSDVTPHSKILPRLLEQFEPIDFQLLAFSNVAELRKKQEGLTKQSIDASGAIIDEGKFNELSKVKQQIEKLKPNQKHYLVSTVENVLEVAKKNSWDICKNHDFIYIYNGAYWAEIDKEEFQKFLGEASERMGVAVHTARYYQFREQLFKQFLATAYLPTPESDQGTVLINLQNGTFEVGQQTPKLRSFDSSDFITYQLPFSYEQDAKAPLFKSYLDRVLPDNDCQLVLAEYLGFVFIRHGSKKLKEEKALVLYGSGANGKSVFFEIVTAMFGRQNVSNYSLQNLTEEKGFYRAKISNKLVNYASEINGKLEASLFKTMVSGEPVEACLKYGQPFSMTNYAKFIFNCNELPKDVEHTNAYFRRFLIIPFDVTIPELEQDKNLHSKIIDSELSGIFNWALQGLNRLLEQEGFSKCDAVQQAIATYRTESDSVQMFLNENEYKASQTAHRLIKELYPEYRTFCSEDGMSPFKKANFLRQLRNASLTVGRVSQNRLAVFIEGSNSCF